MQLLALALYAHDGRMRPVRFQPGKLNVVTGESRTGKSALLTIAEFCLGRDDYLVPVGPIATHTAWYAALWQLTDDPDGPRAFVARPAPPKGQATTQRAMLEFGGTDLDLLPFDSLQQNSDTDSLRRQVGRRIGIAENVVESSGPGMRQTPFEAHLGHAAWLCFQDQDEIASRTLLFHRQSDGKVAEHLKDTLPYFLGAVPADAAAKRVQMRDAQRTLRRAEAALATARNESSQLDSTLRGLVDEAFTAGLIGSRDATTREEMIAALDVARRLQVETEAPTPANPAGPADGAHDVGEAGTSSDVSHEPTADLIELQNRRRALRRRRAELENALAVALNNRELILERSEVEKEFAEAISLHTGRMTSLELIPTMPDGTHTPDDDILGPEESDASGPDGNFDAPGPEDGGDSSDDGGPGADGSDADTSGDPGPDCPVCGSTLAHPDPSPQELGDRLAELRDELQSLEAAPASRQDLLTSIEDDIVRHRDDLNAADRALEALAAADEAAKGERRVVATRNYTRGRIDATMQSIQAVEVDNIARLLEAVEAATARVNRLREETDPANEREQLHSRLNIIGQVMTEYANELDLEHSPVRLDLANLTVVTDSPDGPLRLARVGSAANWVGYHLAAHLALHRFFVENDRPVPHFLMLDQPTQAFFQSEAQARRTKMTGKVADVDRDAVVAMFKVMRDLTEQLTPRMQIIVSDHADLEEPWFRTAVEHDWRDGVKLVPADWLADDEVEVEVGELDLETHNVDGDPDYAEAAGAVNPDGPLETQEPGEAEASESLAALMDGFFSTLIGRLLDELGLDLPGSHEVYDLRIEGLQVDQSSFVMNVVDDFDGFWLVDATLDATIDIHGTMDADAANEAHETGAVELLDDRNYGPVDVRLIGTFSLAQEASCLINPNDGSIDLQQPAAFTLRQSDLT